MTVQNNIFWHQQTIPVVEDWLDSHAIQPTCISKYSNGKVVWQLDNDERIDVHLYPTCCTVNVTRFEEDGQRWQSNHEVKDDASMVEFKTFMSTL